MTNRRKILSSVLFIVFISSVAIAAYEQAKKDKERPKEDLYSQVELFADAISAIRTDYVDEVESKKLIYGALGGMLSSLDDFSQFMEPDEYNEMVIEAKGEFGGVGIEISMRDGVITIIAPISGSPAESAGIKPGDKIIKIDGKITKNMTTSEAVKMMRGSAGTSVILTLWREKDEKVLDIPIKRDIIKIHSIKKASFLQDKIGYIKLIEFQEKAGREMEDALKRLESDGMDSLILDLRNNPGGLLESAVEISEKFLPKDGPIVSIKGKQPAQNIVFKSSGKYTHPAYPLIVLVNEGSASASEILAGAMQDSKRAVIMGTKTFGKGSVQTVIPMKDGSALRLTTASYFTPSGRMIRKQGLIPDVTVEKDVSKEDKDLQLERALDLMKAIKVYKPYQGLR